MSNVFSVSVRFVGEGVRELKRENNDCWRVSLQPGLLRVLFRIHNLGDSPVTIVGLGGLKGLRFIEELRYEGSEECYRFREPSGVFRDLIDVELDPHALLQPDGFIEVCLDMVVNSMDVDTPITLDNLSIYYYTSQMVEGNRPLQKAVNVSGQCVVTVISNFEEKIIMTLINQLIEEGLVARSHAIYVFKYLGKVG